LTNIVKEKSGRKTVFLKPRSGASAKEKPANKPPRKRAAPVKEASVQHEKFPIDIRTDDAKSFSTAVRVLRQFMNVNEPDVEKIVKDPKLLKRFVIYSVKASETKRVDLLTYRKSANVYVVGVCQIEGRTKKFANLVDEDEESAEVAKIAKNYTITVPGITFPEKKALKYILAEIGPERR
jgi:hypothetical protein